MGWNPQTKSVYFITIYHMEKSVVPYSFDVDTIHTEHRSVKTLEEWYDTIYNEAYWYHSIEIWDCELNFNMSDDNSEYELNTPSHSWEWCWLDDFENIIDYLFDELSDIQKEVFISDVNNNFPWGLYIDWISHEDRINESELSYCDICSSCNSEEESVTDERDWCDELLCDDCFDDWYEENWWCCWVWTDDMWLCKECHEHCE